MRVLASILVLSLCAAPGWAADLPSKEHPAVQAAGANLWVSRPAHRAEDVRADSPDLVLHGERGRLRPSGPGAAGVPGLAITVEFPPDSAELDDLQREALYRLTRELRFTPHVRLLWIRTGAGLAPDETGGEALARRRAEALRRATGGKGFPWDRIFLDPHIPPCETAQCQRASRQGVITAIMARRSHP